MALQSIRVTCEPRPDVTTGGLDDNHFAAQLDKVLRAPDKYDVYGQPDDFFAITYPTSGLRTLLERTFARVSEAPHSSGVLRSSTSFGGGKTHGQVALLHLARGARPSNIDEFLDVALLPDGPVPVAALVGDYSDPENGVDYNGNRAYTLWGEMAAQLSDHAWKTLSASDETRTAPGVGTLREAFNDQPAIILIDEIAAYLRTVTSSGNEDIRRMAKAIPVFLKNLFEVASDPTSRVVVVITLATEVNAFGKETDEITAALDEAQKEAAHESAVAALDEAADVLARSTHGGSIIRPASDAEIGEILKRRLFTSIDPAAAQAAAAAYQQIYEDLLERGEPLSGGPEQPASYARQLEASYPFHPELVRVLDKRLGDIPKFQRARGALKLLAEVVAGIYQDQADCDIINVADLNYANPPVLASVTVGIEKPEFEGVALADVAGPASHAASIDHESGLEEHLAQRVNRVVFTHSLESKTAAGASENDWRIGSLRPGEDPAQYQHALDKSLDLAWHLSYDGNRYRYLTEPNVNKILEEEKANVLNSRVNQMTRDLIDQAFKNDAGVSTNIFPQTAADIPDATGLNLAVLDPDMVTVDARHSDDPPSVVQTMFDTAGAAGNPRQYRNAIVFVLADQDTIEQLEDQARALIAAEQLAHDGARMAEFTPEVRTKIEEYEKNARLNARIAVNRAFKHLYHPTNDAAHHHLRHRELPAGVQGKVNTTTTRQVVQLLEEEGKIRSQPMSSSYLKSKAWSSTATSVTTKQLADHFWKDHRLDIVRNKDLLINAIRSGVTNGDWVYLDGDTGKAYTATTMAGLAPEILDTAELLTPDEAKERGVLIRVPLPSDIKKAHRGSTLTGPQLRTELEKICGGEPKKTDVNEALAATVQAGQYRDYVVTDEPPADGTTALTPTEIKAKSLDALHVLTRAAADSIGVVVERRTVTRKTFDATGAGAPALQRVLDQVGDHSISTIQTLTINTQATPNPANRKDLDLLITALGMLPAHPITVELTGVVEYPNLTRGELEISAEGERSDFQAFWTTLNKALPASTALSLDITLTCRWQPPLPTNDPQITTLQKVIKDLQIDSVKVTAEVAPQ